MPDSRPVLGQLTPIIPSGKDIKATLSFYEDVLGFRAGYTADDLSMVIVQRDATEIIIQNNDDSYWASQTSCRIKVSGIDMLYSEYQAHNIAPFYQPHGAGLGTLDNTDYGTREFALRDLAGVCIVFYEDLPS